jgi:predicted GNAT family acetyltransferase
MILASRDCGILPVTGEPRFLRPELRTTVAEDGHAVCTLLPIPKRRSRRVKVALQVQHDVENSRFVADVEGRECVLDYERRNEKILDYKHTFTPEPLRGRGIASDVVRYALSWARRNGQRVVASCPFVQSYVDEHPEVEDVVATEA